MAHKIYKLSMIWALILHTDSGVLCQLLCPFDVTEISSPAKLICKNPNQNIVAFISPNGTKIAACDPNKGCLTHIASRYNATNINTTQSCLKIAAVELSDEGDWTCEDAFTNAKSTCPLVLTEIPACNITSNRNIDELFLEDQLTLFVHIGYHHCTLPPSFQLKSGKNTMELIQNESNVYKSMFYLDGSSFGDVTLLYRCNTSTRNVSCGNIEELKEQTFNCSIKRGKEGDVVREGEETSLEVRIDDYTCSQTPEFMLKSGKTTVDLSKTQSSNETTIFDSSFVTTNDHFGPLRVLFLCNNISRYFTCNGVQHLYNEAQTRVCKSTQMTGASESRHEPNGQIALIAGVSAAVAVVIVTVAIFVVICVIRTRNKPAQENTHVSNNINTTAESFVEMTDIKGCLSKESPKLKYHSEIYQNVGPLPVADNQRHDNMSNASTRTRHENMYAHLNLESKGDDCYQTLRHTYSNI